MTILLKKNSFFILKKKKTKQNKKRTTYDVIISVFFFFFIYKKKKRKANIRAKLKDKALNPPINGFKELKIKTFVKGHSVRIDMRILASARRRQ
jgi:hypothetical protein